MGICSVKIIRIKLEQNTQNIYPECVIKRKRNFEKECIWHHENTPLSFWSPLKPHFYIVKLEFTGEYIIFLFLLKNIDCGYSLEPPWRGGSNEYQQSMFWTEIGKI